MHKRLSGSRVGDVHDENIRGANLGQLVHNRRDGFLLDHGTDGHPAIVLQGGHSRRSLAGSDPRRGSQLRARDVVLAENVSLSGCKAYVSTL